MIALIVTGIAAAMALATWTLGWWGVVMVALVAGAVWRHRNAPRRTALAAALAWGALLLVDAGTGRLPTAATALGGVFRLPAAALLVVTLLFAALLAWSAAAIGQDLAHRIATRPAR